MKHSRFRIIEKYDAIGGYCVYVQENVGWWIFKWWKCHSNESSRYSIDYNFRTVKEAKNYITKYTTCKVVPKTKNIIYV